MALGKRVLLFVLWALGLLYSGARLLMDAIGRSTLVEDSEHAQTLAIRGLEWLFTTPWYVAAALVTVITLLLVLPEPMHWIRRQLTKAMAAKGGTSAPAPKLEQKPELKIVSGARYKNETVPLDGFRYVKCEFDNVTFVYNGGDYDVFECLYTIPFQLRSENHAITRGIDLLSNLSLIRSQESTDGRGHRRVTLKVPPPAKDHPNLIASPRPPGDIAGKKPQ